MDLAETLLPALPRSACDLRYMELDQWFEEFGEQWKVGVVLSALERSGCCGVGYAIPFPSLTARRCVYVV